MTTVVKNRRFEAFINTSGPELLRITESVLEGPFLASWVPYNDGMRLRVYWRDEDGDKNVTTVEISTTMNSHEMKRAIEEGLFRRTELYKK